MTTAIRPQPSSPVRVSILLDPDLLAAYETKAESASAPLEQILAGRLARFLDADDQHGLLLNRRQRAELVKLTGGRVIGDAETAIERLKRAVTVMLTRPGDDPLTVEIPQTLLTKLSSRAAASRTDLADLVGKICIEALESYCQMR